ncbi:MAG: hypothetical protein KDD56_10825, partial [Bdellovibrionales bacterium]|nr:hypothetical protein [Bdellovibrionales bacterium]
MRKYSVTGLGNSLVDILLEVSDQELAELGIDKTSYMLIQEDEQKKLLQKLSNRESVMQSGGSVANSIFSMNELGASCSFLGCVADDPYGIHFKTEMENCGVDFPNHPIVGKTTGTTCVMTTPDAERTMRGCLAVTSSYSEKHINEEIIANSDWIFIEGFLL